MSTFFLFLTSCFFPFPVLFLFSPFLFLSSSSELLSLPLLLLPLPLLEEELLWDYGLFSLSSNSLQILLSRIVSSDWSASSTSVSCIARQTNMARR